MLNCLAIATQFTNNSAKKRTKTTPLTLNAQQLVRHIYRFLHPQEG